ncbi:bifunctional phosphopantothenoylcysteine decarboxylase/phosphopantothenate--cysteine ligase CoaBC [Abyssicoccus albus]|uniref:bifunctional phosphopantothenoylcysteine decarboxylase/phosphopantothenate--cysteine ligase CoaBC n=1 Tax=Abyssicoccus albus TaxID=1817405 RepID=UPI00097E176C|nr:bifunctional phosphopantothenoylcysteine decarboxylase/phosphopantothenate--cysteine ligase CoaBC [Abyssicoccus albus]AQL56351.1 hypothetical protein BVH56_05185 [Abyssicoccus albus]
MKVLLAVTGGIASYKAYELVRMFKKNGHEVKVIMTHSASEFVNRRTFEVLTEQPVYIDTFEEESTAYINHIELGKWCDTFIIAPTTMNTIAKLATGLADNMVTNVAFALDSTVKKYIAPAMNVNMYNHPRTEQNIKVLIEDGYQLIRPGSGFLACGVVDTGRLEDVEVIYNTVIQSDKPINQPLLNKQVIITAGPTLERIDPVRFLSNHSSGKMGLSMAKACERLGATITFIVGPNQLEIPSSFNAIHVESTHEMYKTVMSHIDSMDIFIGASAVSDYTVDQSEHKIKKSDGELVLKLKRTEDILKAVGEQKKTGQTVIGFAAESQTLETYAMKKLNTKHADFIIGNYINQDDSGFKSDMNEVIVYSHNHPPYPIQSNHKDQVAIDIMNFIVGE